MTDEYAQRAMTDEERAASYVAGLHRERAGVEVKITRVDAALGQLGKSKANEANAEALRRERRHHERQLGDVDRELERMADETRGRST